MESFQIWGSPWGMGIRTNERLETSIIGDVNGKQMLAHVALLRIVAVENILGGNALSTTICSIGIYSFPVAVVGLTEQEAAKRAQTLAFLANGKAGGR